MRSIKATAAIILTIVASTASAETVRLSDLTREQEVAIQRGHSVAEAACVFEIITEIEGYGGPEAMLEFSLSFDEEPLQISNGSLTHSCEGGTHTWIENGERLIIQVYDEDGEPTMMEP